MQILNILKNEFTFFKQSNLLGKLFILNLFLLCISIPVKNAIFQFSNIGFIVLFFAHYVSNKTTLVDLKNVFSEYKDIVIGLVLILMAWILSDSLSEYSQSKDFTLIVKYFYRYMLLFFILIYFYSYSLFSKITLTLFLLISLLLYSLHGLYEFMIVHDAQGAIQSFVHNRNPYGLLMFTGIMLATFSLYKLKDMKSQMIIYFITVCFVASLLLSYSRSAWVATGLFVILLMIVHIKKINFRMVCINVVIIGIVAIVIYYNDSFYHRFESLIHLDSSRRFDIWMNTIALIQDKILFGYGIIDYQLIGKENFSGVHNSFLEVLLFTGVVGFLAYFNLIILVIRDIVKNKKYEFLAVVLSLLFISQFDYSITKDKIFLSILTIAMFFVLSHRVEKKRSKGLSS